MVAGFSLTCNPEMVKSKLYDNSVLLKEKCLDGF